MIEVQDGIPMPKPRGRGRRKYPWAALGVGQSFFVPDGSQKRLANAAYQWIRNNPMGQRFETRNMVENGVAGVRVWRTA